VNTFQVMRIHECPLNIAFELSYKSLFLSGSSDHSSLMESHWHKAKLVLAARTVDFIGELQVCAAFLLFMNSFIGEFSPNPYLKNIISTIGRIFHKKKMVQIHQISKKNSTNHQIFIKLVLVHSQKYRKILIFSYFHIKYMWLNLAKSLLRL
jgi:hypothetical protein